MSAQLHSLRFDLTAPWSAPRADMHWPSKSPSKPQLQAPLQSPPPRAAFSARPAIEPAPAKPLGSRIAQVLALIEQQLPVQRRVVHAGDAVYLAATRFECLHVVNAGVFKTVNQAFDGREQVVGLHFRGDWLGLDGIAQAHYGCDAVAMDTGEVWSFRYEDVMQACLREPALLAALHEAMSREIGRDRESMMSLCTLSADARVADFLRHWADCLSLRGLRTDHITLRMTRAEMGSYLGMSLETVSRALSKLARAGLIEFLEKGRRDIHLPDVSALHTYVQQSLTLQ